MDKKNPMIFFILINRNDYIQLHYVYVSYTYIYIYILCRELFSELQIKSWLKNEVR